MCGAFSFAPHQCHFPGTHHPKFGSGVCHEPPTRVRTQLCGPPKPSASFSISSAGTPGFGKGKGNYEKKEACCVCVVELMQRGTDNQEGTTQTERERRASSASHIAWFSLLIELGTRFRPPRMRKRAGQPAGRTPSLVLGSGAQRRRAFCVCDAFAARTHTLHGYAIW